MYISPGNTHVCVYINTYTHTHIYIYVYVLYTYLSICLSIYLSIYIYLYTYIYICKHPYVQLLCNHENTSRNYILLWYCICSVNWTLSWLWPAWSDVEQDSHVLPPSSMWCKNWSNKCARATCVMARLQHWLRRNMKDACAEDFCWRPLHDRVALHLFLRVRYVHLDSLQWVLLSSLILRQPFDANVEA